MTVSGTAPGAPKVLLKFEPYQSKAVSSQWRPLQPMELEAKALALTVVSDKLENLP
jgi:hypothetical protein